MATRFVLQAAASILTAGLGLAWAQGGVPAAATRGRDILPFRLEVGGYYSGVDRGYGNWRGLDADLWVRGSSRFIPAFRVDSQTRPAGTQQNYSLFSYANWSRSFYTVQAVSIAPQRDSQAIYFPKSRYDVKGYWKLPPDRNLVVAAGFTRFDFGGSTRGQIYNAGALYYRNKLVLEGNLFVNRNQPGNLVSASGSLSVQYGTEKRYWLGLTAAGGRELYTYAALTPLEVGFSSYSFNVFFRRWLSRHVGYVVAFDYQDKLQAYRRAGASTRLFFEF